MFFPRNPHRPRFRPQPLPAAIRALRIATILAQHHPHVQLVLLALQLRKESHHAGEPVLALRRGLAAQHRLARCFRQLAPRHVQRNAQLRRMLAQLAKPRPILRPVPRIDRAARQRQPLVGNHQAQIVIHRVAESLAPRARPKGIVEAEQPRLRLAPRPVAIGAFVVAAESQPPALRRLLVRSFLKNHLARFAIRSLHGVHNPRTIFGARRRSCPKAQTPELKGPDRSATPASRIRRAFPPATAD